MPQEMTEFAMAIVRLPFGGVAWNGNCCPADLIGEAVDFPLRKAVGQLIDFRDHVHGLLPHDEILEMLSHIVRPPRAGSLGTGY